METKVLSSVIQKREPLNRSRETNMWQVTSETKIIVEQKKPFRSVPICCKLSGMDPRLNSQDQLMYIRNPRTKLKRELTIKKIFTIRYMCA